MKIEQLDLEGVYLIQNFSAKDERGVFVKTFHKDNFGLNNIETSFKESYYSSSIKNVIRGMHFQIPPHDHNKLVYLTSGEIIDVILDLRKASSTYGKFISIQLKAFSNSIYIPKGCAHGFLAKSEEVTIVYNVSSVYDQRCDRGIRWDSFGFDWNVPNCIVSERDATFPNFKDFISPF